MKKFLGLLFFSLIAMSCQTTVDKTKSQQEAKPADVNYITQQEAEQRAAKISDVHYQLDVDLTKGATNFSGQMTFGFNLIDTSSDIKVDLSDATISRLAINDTDVKSFAVG